MTFYLLIWFKLGHIFGPYPSPYISILIPLSSLFSPFSLLILVLFFLFLFLFSSLPLSLPLAWWNHMIYLPVLNIARVLT